MRTALFGTGSSLVVAAIVLVVATMNIVLSLYAITSIIIILTILMCYLYLIGATFGLIESVAFTIVVGLSVDYTVHLGIAYMNKLAKINDRQSLDKKLEIKQDKGEDMTSSGDDPRIILVKATAAEIGSAILGGAITTTTSVLMLFFCQITFFAKFGQFVFVNIVASFIITFTTFLALLLIIGPLGHTGDIKYLFRNFTFCHTPTTNNIKEESFVEEDLELDQLVELDEEKLQL